MDDQSLNLAPERLQHLVDEAGIKRRDFIKNSGLILGSAFIASTMAPNILLAKLQHRDSIDKKLKLYNRHTGESLDVVFCTPEGYCTKGLDAIDKLMRDHRRNIKVPMDIKLIEGLYKLSLLLGCNLPIEVVCGFRTYFTNKQIRAVGESYHMKGQAVDIRIQGIQTAHLQKAAKLVKIGGVGYYPRAKFVHMDTGAIRFW
ncbi:MAG: DUF882 domain-containing protein [Alphaproteobacteria bacterium]|nr:DUF882 domain-containing protein [Alphaproteobacteria bacterium]